MTEQRNKNRNVPNKLNIPNLRFPGFSDDWKENRLDNIALIERGRFSPRPRNNPIYYGGSFPFVQTSDVVHSKGIIDSHTQTLNEKGLSVSKLFPKGAILITIAANIGYAGVLQRDMACPDSLVGLKCKTETHNWFLNILLEINQPKMDYLAVAAAQKNINIEFLKPYKFKLPSLNEQIKISRFISVINDRIHTQIEIIDNLNTQLKSLSHIILTRRLRFKDENENSFTDWKWMKLDDICIKKSSDISANKIEDNYGEYIIYGASGILKRIDFYKEKNDFISIVKDGAGVGRLLYCKGKSSVLGTMDIIKPKVYINVSFLFYLLSAINFRKYITGSTIPHIYFKDYKNEACYVPSLEEQNRIADFLNSLSEKLLIEKNLLDQLQKQKQYFLQNLFI